MLFIIQNLPKLCSVVAQCISAFSVDFWLQTNLFQSGVLWHLLLYLFNYDYTLEEGGVEKSGESNQQVSKLAPKINLCQNFLKYCFNLRKNGKKCHILEYNVF